jgi:hypothetical protein
MRVTGLMGIENYDWIVKIQLLRSSCSEPIVKSSYDVFETVFCVIFRGRHAGLSGTQRGIVCVFHGLVELIWR